MKKGLHALNLVFEHFPLSFAIGTMGWYIFHAPLCLLAALIAGWLIDADHLFDFAYYACRRYPDIDYSLLRGGGYFKQNQKVFVLLHAWELTALLLILGLAYQIPVLLVAAMAHAAHLLQDQRKYHIRAFGYSLISRIRTKFMFTGFCGDAHER